MTFFYITDFYPDLEEVKYAQMQYHIIAIHYYCLQSVVVSRNLCDFYVSMLGADVYDMFPRDFESSISCCQS